MNRKEFLKKGILGTGMFVASASLGNVLKNEIDELDILKPLGFNHIPNESSSISDHSILHKANTRGNANHGWLNANHTFSFANYHNPDRMHFGVLRVLNDDIIAQGRGFGTHPHDNMEIITIPLEGDLEHKDNMGNSAIIKNGDIQVMSAGTGITHSEYNHSKENPVKLLQIWLFPDKKNVTPRYDQITLNKELLKNNFHQILSPSKEDEGVWIHQKAWFHLGNFSKDFFTNYKVKRTTNGVYIFVIKGKVKIEDQILESRDGFGIWNVADIDVSILEENTEILLMDVPMMIS